MTEDGDAKRPGTLALLWLTSDPDAVAEDLEDLGLRQRADGGFDLRPVVLAVAHGEAAQADRLMIGERIEPADVPTDAAGPRLAALGWATVDIERAAADLGRDLVGEVGEDRALGARGQQLERRGPLSLVLLEPTTEGRIAAALARHGEGPVALYIEGVEAPEAALVAGPTALGHAGRLIRPAYPSGPYVVVLTSAPGAAAP